MKNRGFTPAPIVKKLLLRNTQLVRGFTFIEVLLASGILGFSICGILAAYGSCSVLIGISKNVNTATNAAMAMMEEIRASPFTDIADDYNGLNFVVNNIPSSMGTVFIDDTNPDFLEATVSVSWRQGNRIIGEDVNLNGVLDAGENVDGNGILNSPAEVVTRIANR